MKFPFGVLNHTHSDIPKKPLLYICLYVGLSFIFLGVYRQLFFSGVEDFSSIETSLEEVDTYNSNLNREILRIHNEPFSGFKPVEDILESLTTILLKLQNTTGNIVSEDGVDKKIKSFISAAEHKYTLVERYKISLTSYRASEKYAPVAKKELLRELRSAEIKNIDSYQSLIDNVYTQTQAFLRLPDQDRKKNILSVIGRAEKKLNNISPPMGGVSAFISQCRLLIETKVESYKLLQEVTSEYVPQTYVDAKFALNAYANAIELEQEGNFSIFLWLLISMVSVSVMLMFYLVSFFSRREGRYSIGEVKEIAFDSPGANKKSNKTTDDVSLDDMATKFSHQMETPLRYIQENVDALCPVLEEIHETFDALENDYDKRVLPESLIYLMRSSTVSEFPFAISEIKDGIRSARLVVNNIRQFSRRERTAPTAMDLNKTIEKVIKMKSKMLEPIATVKLKLSQDPAIFSAVPNDIGHIIECLIDNAAEAIDDGYVMPGVIEVTTVVQRGVVKLMVRDNGGGISNEIADRIYDPFFTTKKSGVGMGLTLVRKTVERHNGKIDVVSNPDSGAIVRISFACDVNRYTDSQEEKKQSPEAGKCNAPANKLVAVANNEDKTQVMFHKNKIENKGGRRKTHSITQNESDQLNKFTCSLAEQNGKKAELVTHGLDTIVVTSEIKKLILEISEQCIRNSVEHGIEEPYYRMYVGKPQKGIIELGLSKNNDGTIELGISDDGRGIDCDAIRERAVELGLHPMQEISLWNKSQLADLIYDPRFSTVDNASRNRGVGMNAIRGRIKGLDGEIKIASRKGINTKVFITIPHAIRDEIAA